MPPESPQRLAAGRAAPAPNVNTLWAGILVDELARCGLRDVCISPGSRSAPLVFQFAAHPGIDDHSVIDERSGGFFALGLARATGRPVALLCTSGTAAANYYPAVCEAEQDGIPLLVLTGDRPPEDHDCGAQQVMEQARLYGSHVRWHHQVAQPEATAHKLAYLRSLACRALHRTRYPQPGPVHLDLPFRKPLEPVQVDPDHPDHISESMLAEAEPAIRGRASGAPWVRIHAANGAADDLSAERLAEALDGARRPLVVAGSDPAGRLYRASLRDLATHAGIPVFAEPSSGLRHWRARGANVIGASDLVAGSGFHARHGAPDLVIRTGSAPLSWEMQNFMRRCGDAVHFAVGAGATLVDPEHMVDEQLIADPHALFQRVASRVRAARPDRDAWLRAHLAADARAVAELTARLASARHFSAPAMWHVLGSLLPDGTGLYFSSSMLVRHLDTFMCAHAGDLDVHFNRGLNGIDGVVSTAAGIAAGRAKAADGKPGPMLLVIGDIALRHDAGALLLAQEMGLDLTVLVVDNDGGEIFDYLPSAAYGEVHEKHFATSGGTPVARFIPRGVELLEPRSWEEFGRQVPASLAAGGQRVIRFATRRDYDHRLRGELVAAISRSIEYAVDESGDGSLAGA